ncbi:hypothetical protein [Legionella gresilensis]|uniref:hypothetical protein n=1 Tax=Legionella gresilensis TaxID=91823 RepID=UPI0010410922|nr:hypothetical protein [Legionella gresilensis]
MPRSTIDNQFSAEQQNPFTQSQEFYYLNGDRVPLMIINQSYIERMNPENKTRKLRFILENDRYIRIYTRKEYHNNRLFFADGQLIKDKKITDTHFKVSPTDHYVKIKNEAGKEDEVQVFTQSQLEKLGIRPSTKLAKPRGIIYSKSDSDKKKLNNDFYSEVIRPLNILSAPNLVSGNNSSPRSEKVNKLMQEELSIANSWDKNNLDLIETLRDTSGAHDNESPQEVEIGEQLRKRQKSNLTFLASAPDYQYWDSYVSWEIAASNPPHTVTPESHATTSKDNSEMFDKLPLEEIDPCILSSAESLPPHFLAPSLSNYSQTTLISPADSEARPPIQNQPTHHLRPNFVNYSQTTLMSPADSEPMPPAEQNQASIDSRSLPFEKQFLERRQAQSVNYNTSLVNRGFFASNPSSIVENQLEGTEPNFYGNYD